MRRLTEFTGLALALAAAGTAAHEFDGELTARLFGRLEGREQRLTDFGLRTQLRYTHSTEQGLSLYAEGRLRWNGIYLVDNPYSEKAEEAYELAYDWRELYFRLPVLGWDWSLGLQQVVWGRADEVRVLDQVNPLDLREFVLLDLEDYREAVPVVRVNRRVGDWDTELVYLPRFRATSLAKPGSEFFIPLIDPAVAAQVPLLSGKDYHGFAEAAEVGLNLQRSFEGLDLTLIAFYTRDDLPVFRQVVLDDGVVGLRPEHHRYFSAGAGLATPVGDAMVLRSEFTYVPQRTFTVEEPAGDGLDRSGVLTGLVGLDYTYADWLLTVQVLDQYLLDRRSNYLEERHSPTVTLTVQGTSLAARLETRLFWAVMPLHGDGSWLQIRNAYSFSDHWSASLVFDLLQGSSDGFFGQFGNKDRIGLEVTYRF